MNRTEELALWEAIAHQWQAKVEAVRAENRTTATIRHHERRLQRAIERRDQAEAARAAIGTHVCSVCGRVCPTEAS